MPIVQQGSINTTALIVPDLYVQIVAPQNLVINGVPTNRVGMVGTASWGPVGLASIVGLMADYARQFGPVMNRKYDMGTVLASAVQQGAQDFRCVRVTDGTDTAASVVVQTNGATLTGLYTGTLGNNINVILGTGSARVSTRVTVALPGIQPEVFDNIAPGAITTNTSIVTASASAPVANLTGIVVGMVVSGTGVSGSPTVSAINTVTSTLTLSSVQTLANGATLTFSVAPGTIWTAIAAAINSGSGSLRGPSQIISAVAGASATAPTNGTYVLASGTDGATTITAATLVGVDTLPRKGMYSLRGQGCSIGVLADTDDVTQWTIQAGFGLAEGLYMMLVAPAGSAISNGTNGTVDLKNAAGLDSYGAKLLHGDWIYWYDQVNQLLRVISPQGFAAGRLANLSPEQSSLNKPLYGVVGSQKSGLPGSGVTQTYASADLTALFQAGIDVISNPQPAGAIWGLRSGHNSSTNAATNGDNYTRMTNYIASSVNAAMGLYVGAVTNLTLLDRIRATLLSFLENMRNQGLLALTLLGKLPFSVVCDATNNPLSRTSLGYVQADVAIQYQAINEKFIINLEGGTTVQVQRQTSPAGQQ